MISVRYYPTAFSTDYTEYECEPNQSINEMLGGDYSELFSVTANGYIVPKAFFQNVKYEDGTVIEVKAVPNVTGAVLVSAGIFASTGLAATATAFAINVAIGVALSYASNALFAPEVPKPGSASRGFDSLSTLTGTENTVTQYTPIPKLYGKYKFYPVIPVTGKPYTEIGGEDNDDQYLRQYFVLSSGRIEIGGAKVGGPNDFKITETSLLNNINGQYPITIGADPINTFDDYEFEIGRPDQISLYTNEVVETNPAWSTESDIQTNYDDYASDETAYAVDGDSIIKKTEPNTTEISVGLSGPLHAIDSGGDYRKLRVNFELAHRRTGSTDSWITQEFEMKDNNGKTARKNLRITNLDPDQYDVRIKRIDTYASDMEQEPSTKITWNALRSIKDSKPFNVENVVVAALRIRATDQLRGRLKKLGVQATSVLDVYDIDTNTWKQETTRNPAWVFADILTNKDENRNPVEQSALDISEIVAWANDNDNNGLHYDSLLDTKQPTLTRIKEATTAGRAAWNIRADNTISVVRDIVPSYPKMILTPRNTSGYSYSLSAFNPPNLIKVQYTDEDTWQDEERLVYDDGYDATNAKKIISMPAVGCTTADQAWQFGRYHLASMRLRGIEQHSFSIGAASLHFDRGDYIEYQNDIIAVGLRAGRVTSVTYNNDDQIIGFTSDELLLMEPDKSYVCKFQTFDGTVFAARVNNTVGTEIAFQQPLDENLELESDVHFACGELGKATVELKVNQINRKNNFQATVTCEPLARNIPDALDGTIPEFAPNISDPVDPQNYPPNTPQILSVRSDNSVATRADDGSLIWNIAVEVRPHGGAVETDRIQVGIKRNSLDPDDTYTYTNQVADDNIALFPGYLPGDLVDIRARAVSANGIPSAYVTQADYEVIGRVPLAPTGINVTRHTFSADLAAIGQPGQQYEYFISGVQLALVDVLSNATRVNKNSASTAIANDLQPDTQYWVYARAVNIHGASDFVGVSFTTKNEASALLKALNSKLTKTQLSQGLASDVDNIQDLNNLFYRRVAGTDSDGKIIFGGYGIGVDGDEVTAITNADNFAIGKAGSKADYPFVFDTVNELAVLKAANIGDLTFTKLTDDQGSFIVQNGKIKGEYFDVDNLQVNYSAVFGPKPPVDAEKNGASSLNIIINQNITGAQPGESMLYGSTNGEPDLSVDGFIVWNGSKITIPRYQFPNETLETGASPTSNGFVCFDTAQRSGFVIAGSYDADVVAVRKKGNQWQFDNNSVWVDFTPDSNHVALGWIRCGGDNIEGAGLFGQPVSLDVASFPGADKTNENAAKSVDIPDTRDDNKKPEWYWGNYPKQSVTEFKRSSTIGLSLSSTYVALITNVQWSDGSGSEISQTVNHQDAVYVRTGSGDSWDSWTRTDETGSNTANDVKTGSGKAVRQSGADRTSINTSYNTNRVNGRSASTVKNEARDGTNAKTRTDDWTRPNSTRIDGNKIYSGDAYLDTISVKGNAITRTTSNTLTSEKSLNRNQLTYIMAVYAPSTGLTSDEPALLMLTVQFEYDDNDDPAECNLQIRRKGSQIFYQKIASDFQPDGRKSYSIILPTTVDHNALTTFAMYVSLGGDNRKKVYTASMTVLDTYR